VPGLQRVGLGVQANHGQHRASKEKAALALATIEVSAVAPLRIAANIARLPELLKR
jgi:hypothetical protein